MLNIFLDREHYIIDSNDSFFDSFAIPVIISEEGEGLRRIIERVEGVQFCRDGRKFLSKFTKEAINLTELSTGCKTIINVYLSSYFSFNNNEYIFKKDGKGTLIFNVIECGSNYINEIYKIQQGNIFMPNYIFTNDCDNVKNKYVLWRGNKVIKTLLDLDAVERWYLDNE